MSVDRVAEAKTRLPELINRPPAKPISAEDIDWISRQRVGKKKPTRENSGALLRSMRDKDWR